MSEIGLWDVFDVPSVDIRLGLEFKHCYDQKKMIKYLEYN